MLASPVWIVVADSARAHILTPKGSPKRLVTLREMAHPESRMAGRELTSNRPGRSFESFGEMRHAMAPSTDPQQVEKHKFAVEVAHALELARKEALVDRIVLVAAPAFLGALRTLMTEKTRAIVEREIPKDMSNMKRQDLQRHLPEDLFA